MNAIVFCICLIFVAEANASDTNLVKLFAQERRRGSADHFWIGEQKLVSASRWNPEKIERPPLSISEAISIGRKYLMKKEDVLSLKLETATFIRMADHGFFQDVVYYRIQFNLGEFDHPVAIVLMDGTAVEPIPGPSKYDPPR
jgi:hypothetical protein